MFITITTLGHVLELRGKARGGVWGRREGEKFLNRKLVLCSSLLLHVCVAVWSNYWDFAFCFQPLTNFSSKKCKRCGLYEEDSITSDDAFDEWEFCPDDFTAPRGEYIKFTEKEFNATFMCPDCLSLAGGQYLATFCFQDSLFPQSYIMLFVFDQ